MACVWNMLGTPLVLHILASSLLLYKEHFNAIIVKSLHSEALKSHR